MANERELRVLILDDDPDDVMLLTDAVYDALDPAPVRIDHVARVRDAEEALDDGRYDLAFFDYHLGMETGLDLLKQLDRKGPLPCPILILTGQGNEEVAVDAMKAGAADYIIKDVLNPDLIALSMRRALRSEEDRRRRREAEAALERLRRQYELILRSAGEGIMGLDRTGRITFANPAAVALTGWDEQRVKGRDAHRLLHRSGPEDQCEEDPCPLKTALEGGKFRETSDDRFWRSDGISLPVRYVITPILEDGVRVGSVIAFSDTTVLRQAEEARRLANERLLEVEHLKEIDRFRSRFLNTASHELNAPLTPIKTQLHLMRRRGLEDVPTEHQRSIDIVERNVERLSSLINDLLDVTRIQNENLRIFREDIDVGTLIDTVVQDFRDSAEEAGVALRAEHDADLRIEADPNRLRQAIENLVINAIKFTDRGGEVTLHGQRSGDDIEVVVQDNGIGIPEAAISSLFRPFTHGREDHPRSGAGLGLSIARGIIRQHGGDITAESAGPGQGARFIVRLYRDQPTSGGPEREPGTVSGPDDQDSDPGTVTGTDDQESDPEHRSGTQRG